MWMPIEKIIHGLYGRKKLSRAKLEWMIRYQDDVIEELSRQVAELVRKGITVYPVQEAPLDQKALEKGLEDVFLRDLPTVGGTYADWLKQQAGKQHPETGKEE